MTVYNVVTQEGMIVGCSIKNYEDAKDKAEDVNGVVVPIVVEEEDYDC